MYSLSAIENPFGSLCGPEEGEDLGSKELGVALRLERPEALFAVVGRDAGTDASVAGGCSASSAAALAVLVLERTVCARNSVGGSCVSGPECGAIETCITKVTAGILTDRVTDGGEMCKAIILEVTAVISPVGTIPGIIMTFFMNILSTYKKYINRIYSIASIITQIIISIIPTA